MTTETFGCKKCEGHDFTLSSNQTEIVYTALLMLQVDFKNSQLTSPLLLEELSGLLAKVMKMKRYHAIKERKTI